jgi:predicted O-methyltransferase YrrM
MELKRWGKVDGYLSGLFLPHDDALDAALGDSAKAGLPAIQVSPIQGKFLQVLARAVAARRILEIGTLGGYSTIWLARALPPDGRLITLEIDSRHAAIARGNIARAGLESQVEVRVGPAIESLAQLAAERSEPFDFIFIDADKPGYTAYLEAVLRLSHEGTLLVADNVVRKGAIAQRMNDDPNVLGIRRFLERLAAEPRVSAGVMQTVGSKGYDGFAIALVLRDG